MKTPYALLVAGMALAIGSTAQAASPVVKFETSLGNISIKLEPGRAPISVKNFITYVKEGHYDGAIFHRVIPGFMIQGGGFTANMKEIPVHAPIKNEHDNGLKNDAGTIAMARTSDPHSATAQFFINVADNTPLNFRFPTAEGYGYTVFGKVIKGMDIVQRIEKVPTGSPTSETPGMVGLLTRLTLRTWASNDRSLMVGAICQKKPSGTSMI